MGYIESNLLPDERIVYKAKLHWKVYWKAALIILVGVALLFFEPTLGGVVILGGVLAGVPAFVAAKTSEFAVTNKRIIIKIGWLRRRTLELLLRQVEAISVEQSVVGRILDYGSVTLTGTGGVREVFHDIASPLEFRRRIHEQAA